jgi:2-polyprenyl-6-hydroxyphenyl methylase / 3-demethylubiquinone-9 3-methyltransferase
MFETGRWRAQDRMAERQVLLRGPASRKATRRPRNDLRQYDDLVDEWWRPSGAFAALHWLAESRRALVPVPSNQGEVLVDVGCGAGLMAEAARGYVHVGVDLVRSSLEQAQSHGLSAICADAARLPFATGSASVVIAGEVLEHVTDLDATVKEVCRVLRPGGTVVIDTINNTTLAKFLMVTIAERLPGGPPRGIHDPLLFIESKRLQQLFAVHDVELEVWGLRPSLHDYFRFLVGRARPVRMLRTRSAGIVYQGVGTKRRER